jgi:hypothetical protein
VPAVHAAEDPYDGHWHFTLIPYLWLPGIDAGLRFDTPSGGSDVSVKPGGILSNLNFGFMVAGEARKGNWSINTDFIYLSLSDEDAVVKTVTGPGGIVEVPIDVGSQVGLKGFIWTLAPGYTVLRGAGGSLDLLVGFRDAQLKPSLEWQFSGPLASFPFAEAGSVSRTVVIWDAIIGAKGRINLADNGKWFIPYYVDIGTGSSTFTAQGLVGIGYAFEWGDVHLDYRALYYDTEDNRVLDHLILHGLTLGATFHF